MRKFSKLLSAIFVGSFVAVPTLHAESLVTAVSKLRAKNVYTPTYSPTASSYSASTPIAVASTAPSYSASPAYSASPSPYSTPSYASNPGYYATPAITTAPVAESPMLMAAAAPAAPAPRLVDNALLNALIAVVNIRALQQLGGNLNQSTLMKAAYLAPIDGSPALFGIAYLRTSTVPGVNHPVTHARVAIVPINAADRNLVLPTDAIWPSLSQKCDSGWVPVDGVDFSFVNCTMFTPERDASGAYIIDEDPIFGSRTGRAVTAKARLRTGISGHTLPALELVGNSNAPAADPFNPIIIEGKASRAVFDGATGDNFNSIPQMTYYIDPLDSRYNYPVDIFAPDEFARLRNSDAAVADSPTIGRICQINSYNGFLSYEKQTLNSMPRDGMARYTSAGWITERNTAYLTQRLTALECIRR